MNRTARDVLIKTAIQYCQSCDALLTSCDDQMGCCTQCEARLPALRRLLVKVAGAYADDPGVSDLYDEQPAHDPQLNLGHVRLARSLLR